MIYQYLSAALLLAVSYAVCGIINYALTARRHASHAGWAGALPPALRKAKYPFGIDFLLRLIDADKRSQVPNEFEALRNEMGCDTWKQSFLGATQIMTFDPKNIQAILATQVSDFETGPTRRGNFFPLLGNGIFTTDGKAWEHSRAMLRPQFARDQVCDLKLEETHLQDLFKHINVDQSGWSQQLDLGPMFFRLTLDSATEFLFGQSVHSQTAALPGREEDTEKSGLGAELDWATLGGSFDRATHALGVRARMADAYYLYSPRTFRDDCRKVHEFADHYVNLALKKGSTQSVEAESGGKQRYVFLAEFAKTTRDPVELRSQLLNILLAGRDTTAGLLGWTFWLLARHPETFNKLRSIVLESFGTYDSPDISFEKLKGCTYLQDVIKEVLRLYPSVPLNSRRATKDTTLPTGGGPDGSSPIFVPKHTEVNYSCHVLQRRTDIYGADALEFKPERWTDLRPGWAYIPFNGGPRLCLGQQFALTEASYNTVRFLQRFDRIESLDHSSEVRHQLSVTTAPVSVDVRLHEAAR